MFDLLRFNRKRHADNPRNVARERMRSTIHRDRMAVSAPQLAALQNSLLYTIREHLPVAPEFTEFGLHREGDDLILISRVRLQERV